MALFAFAACGGDDDDPASPTSPQGVPTARTAEEVIPDMAALGFKPAAEQLPGINQGDSSKIALYENPAGAVKSVRFEIAVAPNTNVAQAQFTALADALKNPPPGLFGADTNQIPGTAVFQGDQSRSYKTDKPDKEGTIVFSDIHRFGRAIVIMYSIGSEGAEAESVRKALAEQMAARAPR
jgi:hypothetical protein